MPLSCDCYAGCWAEHSENWLKVGTIDTINDMVKKARESLPYGTYVIMKDHLRLENQGVLSMLISQTPYSIRHVIKRIEIDVQLMQGSTVVENLGYYIDDSDDFGPAFRGRVVGRGLVTKTFDGFKTKEEAKASDAAWTEDV